MNIGVIPDQLAALEPERIHSPDALSQRREAIARVEHALFVRDRNVACSLVGSQLLERFVERTRRHVESFVT